jgi:hemolysin III
MPQHLKDSTRGEYYVDGVVHLVGVTGGAAAVRWMWARAGASAYSAWAALSSALVSGGAVSKGGGAGLRAVDAADAVDAAEAAVLVYGFGLLAMLVCSAAYNLLYWTRLGTTLRRFDHAAIFLKITSGYHPWLAASKLKDWEWSPTVLSAVWAVGLTGVMVKLLLLVHLLPPALQRTVENVTQAAYLLLGWTGGIIAWEFRQRLEFAPCALLLAGGVVYSLGFLFFRWESLRYQMAIWHCFVLGGAALQFAALALELNLLEQAKDEGAPSYDGESVQMSSYDIADAAAASAAEL